MVVAVALGAFALAGCGGDGRPYLPRTDAAPLIALSKRIAHEGRCAQARDIRILQTRTIALVNAHRIPAALQESLLSGVNQLAAQTPVCVPRVTPVTTTPAAPSPHTHGKGKHRGHGEGD